MKKRPFKNKKGFSLIELLVVMSIIVGMSVLVLAKYRGSQGRYSLNLAVQQIVSNLRQAQNSAISGKGLAESYKGYGIYFEVDKSSYILFGDVNGNQTYETPTADITMETVQLPNGIKISSIRRGTNSYSYAEVDFEPPVPKTYIKGRSAEDDERVLIINLSNAEGLSKSVEVSPFGIIKAD